MRGFTKPLIIIILVAIVALLVAFFWPRPCTPDVECADYDEFLQEINARTTK